MMRSFTAARSMWIVLAGCAAVGLVLPTWLVARAAAQIDESLWVMYHDPELSAPELIVRHDPRLVDLWLQALTQQDVDLKRRAAETIALARQRGVDGLDKTTAQLMTLLRGPGEPRVVRLTAARALVAIDAREAAELLQKQLSERDLEMAEIVEPALARWSHLPAVELWMRRLESTDSFHRARVLAIEGLAATGSDQVVPRLQALAADRHVSEGIRIAAADALGQLAEAGLLDTARELAQDGSPRSFVDRLVAVKMLAGHTGGEAEQLLVQFATDPMPTIQALALQQLHRIDPRLVMPLADGLITSRDANVRTRIAEALIAVARQPELDNIVKLRPLLDDPHPQLRTRVREAFIELAELDGFRQPILAETRRALDEFGWRGKEQAMRVLVALREQPAVERFLDLLDHERLEVHVTAAWGLCELAVPETLERILEVFQRNTQARLAMEIQAWGMEEQMAHLAQALGKMNYQPADETLRLYIPKSTPLWVPTRAAAIWALGHLHQDASDDEMAGQLLARLRDVNSDEPEDALVRRFSAIALGFMKSENTLLGLERVAASEGVREAPGIASAWAVHRITGRPVPEVPPIIRRDSAWFLIPTYDGASTQEDQ